jgi:hypothetical protein
MRVLEARWIGLVVLAVGMVAMAGQATAAEGRWKLGGDGACYFDAADSGPDQCAPMTGRWKLGGDGNCYFDANDGGPDQCVPVEATPATIAPDDDAAAPLGEHEGAVPAGAVDPASGTRPQPRGAPTAA